MVYNTHLLFLQVLVMAEQRGENCAKEEMTSSKGSSPTKEEASSKKVNEQNM